MNRESSRMCHIWVTEYLIRQKKMHVQVTANDICVELNLPPGSALQISSFLKTNCYSRNNRGYHVAELHNNAADRKLYSITLRPTFDRLAEKILDD